MIASLTKKARRELREAVVASAFGASEDPLDVRVQSRLAPVIPSGFLGAGGLALARCLEQGFRGGSIVAGIVARGKHEVSFGSAGAGVLVHEGSTHITEYYLASFGAATVAVIRVT